MFNLGSDSQITIGELADRILELSGGAGGKRLVSYEQAFGPDFEDPPHRLPDTTRIREAIAFKPTYTLDQTLTELIELCRGGQEDGLVNQGASGGGG